MQSNWWQELERELEQQFDSFLKDHPGQRELLEQEELRAQQQRRQTRLQEIEARRDGDVGVNGNGRSAQQNAAHLNIAQIKPRLERVAGLAGAVSRKGRDDIRKQLLLRGARLCRAHAIARGEELGRLAAAYGRCAAVG